MKWGHSIISVKNGAGDRVSYLLILFLFLWIIIFNGSKKTTAEFIISEGFGFLLLAKMDSDDSLLLMLLLPSNSKWHY